MSGFGKATPRAWQRNRARASPSRDDAEYAKDSARMAHIIAGMFCPSCGTVVREDGLHDAQCIDVPPDRRRPDNNRKA